MNKARRMEGIKGLLYRVHIEAWPPRGIALNVCIALLMLAVLACSLTSPNAAPPSNGVVGTLTRQLDLVEKGVDQASLQEVIDSEVLAAGELVRVSNGGEALLDYGNQLQLRLFNDTRTNLVEATSALGAPLSVRLVLELGGMTGRLDNPGGSFQVRTPGGAQVLVLGTRFFVIYDPATRITWVGNFEGLLGVTAGGAVVQVPPGTYLMVPAGERPGPPLPLPFDQVQFEQRARQLSSASAALARLAIERRSTETQIAGITGITTVTTPVITPLITDTPPAPTQTPIQPTDTPAQEGPPSNGSPTRTNTSIPQPGDIKPPSITVLPPSQEAIGVGKTCPPGAGIVRLKAVAFDPGGVSAVTASWSLGALHGVEQLRDNAKGNYIGEIGPVDITGKMRVTVYAVDRAGNLSSAPTLEVNLYPCPDTRTPVIGMLETTPQVSMFQACSGTPNPLTLYTRVEDDGQVDRVVAILKVGGESSTIEMEALGDGRYRTTLFLESLAGDVSLHVEAFDTAGNQGMSSSSITVGNCQAPLTLTPTLTPTDTQTPTPTNTPTPTPSDTPTPTHTDTGEPSEPADLLPVPDEIGSYCLLRENGNLVVTVLNQGNYEAGLSVTAVNFVKVKKVLTMDTSALSPGASTDLFFPIPTGCYSPNCEFRIVVDIRKSVFESNEDNNAVLGDCPG